MKHAGVAVPQDFWKIVVHFAGMHMRTNALCSSTIASKLIRETLWMRASSVSLSGERQPGSNNRLILHACPPCRFSYSSDLQTAPAVTAWPVCCCLLLNTCINSAMQKEHWA